MHLYLAPAAAGKTAYLLRMARQVCRDLRETPRVVVSTQLQVRAWRQRLAAAGGALGVRIGTFDMLYRDILAAAGEVYTVIGEPVQFRLVRKVIEEGRLIHYASLQGMPGFVQVASRLMGELKAAGIRPEALAEALGGEAGEPRLGELADLYLAYQEILQAHEWADYPGIGWLAAEALEKHPSVGQGWSPVWVDGFDDLTTVQLRVLTLLSRRAKDLVVTLTGARDGSRRHLVHRRFNRTRDRLEKAFGVEAEPLPQVRGLTPRPQALVYLEANFLQGAPVQAPVGDVVRMVAAPDRPGEVREALRWLKERLVVDGMRLREVALLARNVFPYRSFIVQTAQEFGLPVQLVDGYPLRGNPAIAALMDVLRLALPSEAPPSEAAPSFPWRSVVAAWRSPYFDWRFHSPEESVPSESGVATITLQDAEALDRVARWASVVGGLDQWMQAFDMLGEAGNGENLEEGERGTSSVASTGVNAAETEGNVIPTGAGAMALRRAFDAFVQRVTPPAGQLPCREFVAWLETLIGDFEEPEEPAERAGGDFSGVGLARCIEKGPAQLRERDTAALNALKDVLRGLVWADEAVACRTVNFIRFFADLVGAIEAAVYRPPLSAREEAVLVADVAAARGLSFRAVAILGLAEGEFPAALSEDPLLRDRDRGRLRDDHDFALNLSSDSAEAGYFYEAFTRATAALLLTRPRVADNGATWQASPYWDEVCGWLAVEPVELKSGSHPEVGRGASLSEVVFAAAALWETNPAVGAWLREAYPHRCAALTVASTVIHQRAALQSAPDAGHDGGLQPWAADFSVRYAPERSWSASRLEAYATCPFLFFVGHALDLEARRPPLEGLDARQLGNIYHHIFESLYELVSDPMTLEELVAALPAVAEDILDQAPRREQFRPNAWWAQTRTEIIDNVRRSLEELDAMRGDFLPYAFEAAFGLDGRPYLEVHDGVDRFLLRGFIDRVERSPSGAVRVIDYKTAGKAKFTARALHTGKKLQLALYALAAQQALGLGEVVDGFYWHVRSAERSSFTLARYEGGVEAATAAAVAHAWSAVRGARLGAFLPAPPADGCPGYCAASGFCWHYSPGW